MTKLQNTIASGLLVAGYLLPGLYFENWSKQALIDKCAISAEGLAQWNRPAAIASWPLIALVSATQKRVC